VRRVPVILDTDIGDDIDDSWALPLLLRSPELDVKLITTATGDTTYRARLTARLLEGGRPHRRASGLRPGRAGSDPAAALKAFRKSTPCSANR
jgi:hypothetical protein